MSGHGILIRGEGGSLKGNITTMTIGLGIELRLSDRFEERNPDSPKFDVFGKGTHGRETLIGKAWEKTAERGPRPGEKYLTLSLDDPSWDAPLYVTAFPRDGGNYEIVWRRPKARPDGATFRADTGRSVVDEELPL